MKKALCGLVLVLASCDGGGSHDVMSADFRTMAECLESIPASAKSQIKETFKDTPERVSGVLLDGRHFACDRKETGTKGIYFEGYYDVK